MIRLAVLLLAALHAAVPARAGGAPSFLAYLQGARPAMIAYVPSGFDPRLPSRGVWPDEALRADLAALRPGFDGLVLYAFRQDVTPGILEHAAAQGYRAVLLGIWDPRSEAEIAGTAALLRRWGDRLALAVVVGNEGINDNRYTMADLAAARDRLRALTDAPVPVTTSEPAGDYGWPPLRGFGDFLAPNIHPAIDQDGRDPAAAVAWVRARAEAIARVAGRPVLVKETGQPNGGGEPHSPQRQRAFWAAWLAAGRIARLDRPEAFVSFAAAFEAFDAPWKAVELKDPIEAHWGLMTPERRLYPAFTAWVDAAGPGR